MSKKYTNYFTGKPDSTPNNNVPEGANLICRASYTNGEIVFDYYCQRYNPPHPEYGHWALWKVCDWIDSKPQPVNFMEVLTVINDFVCEEYENRDAMVR